MIPFNKPFFTGEETAYIEQAVHSGKISGNGIFTQKCQNFFENKYGIKKALLTTSCTDALEMCALLLNIKDGDEIIMPSYTFVSTANAFVLRGAKIIFCDSKKNQPNIDETKIEKLISERTKAIVVVHYSGVACEMDEILSIAKKHSLFVVEDAAQAIESYYKGRPLGSIGHLATFSFHETKNIQCGEGGLLAINDEQFIERAEIIWEKGTNRSAFFRGEIDKYGWVDIGSSFLPSEIIAAFLYAQLEKMKIIQSRRIEIWEQYNKQLLPIQKQGKFYLPIIPDYATHNGHLFYLVCKSFNERRKLINYLNQKEVQAVFHYQPLHKSQYFKNKYTGDPLVNCDRFGECLVRLPFFYELTESQQAHITKEIQQFYS
jgi:dTDP-4-amino-4,6-dideoxygalactose transaminase